MAKSTPGETACDPGALQADRKELSVHEQDHRPCHPHHGGHTSQAQDLGRVLSATPSPSRWPCRSRCAATRPFTTGAPDDRRWRSAGRHCRWRRGQCHWQRRRPRRSHGPGVIGGARCWATRSRAAAPGYQNVQRCTTETYYDQRVIGYDVTYEYAGRSYTTRPSPIPGSGFRLPCSRPCRAYRLHAARLRSAERRRSRLRSPWRGLRHPAGPAGPMWCRHRRSTSTATPITATTPIASP